MKTILELEQQFKNEHFFRYAEFTKQLLTLSAGSLSLLAALDGKTTVGATTGASNTCVLLAWLLFLSSILLGLLVQHLVAQRPIRDLALAEELLQKRLIEDPDNPDPVMVQRTPSKTEQISYQAQVWSFLLAFCFLAASVALKRLGVL